MPSFKFPPQRTRGKVALESIRAQKEERKERAKERMRKEEREGEKEGKGKGKRRERQRTKGRKGGGNACLRNCAHGLTKILIKY